MRALCRISLFTHIHLDIAYNQDRVIEVNVSTDASHTVRHQLGPLRSVPACPLRMLLLKQHHQLQFPVAQCPGLGCASVNCKWCSRHGCGLEEPLACRQVDISADVTPNTEDGTIRADFTYTVVWSPTDTPYARRMEKYRRVQFLPQHLEVHWFSIVNSIITVLLLTGFLATILLRVVRQDFQRFSRDDDGARFVKPTT